MFENYNTDIISKRLSLRAPQQESLEILDDILSKVDLTYGATDNSAALNLIREMYPTCTDFGRDFISLAFVLATGVGKTRLMGAFISYLYTVKGLKNFFVVAPNTVIYEKLKDDLGNPTNDKYVFKGLDCFAVNPPHIITGEDYRNRQLPLTDFYSDANIYIYNISKFDKEQTKMRAVNEWLGESFVDALANVQDLVLIMDEAHHYHAAKGAKALNDLKPILGLELTATPYYNQGSKQKNFTNAVYEYPLSYSIRDGYTRTPYALTRSDFKTYGFDENTQDQVMLHDAIVSHERIKLQLETYAAQTGKRRVKPFVLVVCKDTDHANRIHSYIKSDAFFDGSYKNKTIIIHSGQKREEKEDNVTLLQNVESADNPIEIVIHVNKLKEGWDVNNLYTIVPLRTAASKILREQMVGRGLRLPFGERTGIPELDMVVLTAHDNFTELLLEAQSEDSIFNKDKVLYAEELEELEVVQPVVNQIKIDYPSNVVIGSLEATEDELKIIQQTIAKDVSKSFTPHADEAPSHEEIARKCIEQLKAKASEDADRQAEYDRNMGPLFEYACTMSEHIEVASREKFIPIPRIRIIESGRTDYLFSDFDLDFTPFDYYQPTDQTLTLTNLRNQSESIRIAGQGLSFNEDPKSNLIAKLRQKPEINYDRDSDLIQKLVKQLLAGFEYKFGTDGMENIVYMNKSDLADRIYSQMISKHNVKREYGCLIEEVDGYNYDNYPTPLTGRETCDLFHTPSSPGNIRNFIFTNIIKGVFNTAKFDSMPELVFARVVENDPAVLNWLRPSPEQFEIYYSGGHRYEPDFVVETLDKVYLVEVKGENQFSDQAVKNKAQRGLDYCNAASNYAVANHEKPWVYLFLPSKTISNDSSFGGLLNQNYVSELLKPTF